MLVYGDATIETTPALKLAAVRRRFAEACACSGIARHGLLVAALIEAGELAQGIADAAFEARGRVDAAAPAPDAAMALTCALASCVAASWTSLFATLGNTGEVEAALIRLEHRTDLPAAITVKQPEGFAHYGVYPEAYLAAASGLPAGITGVIGIRSIGTVLAAMMAAALPEVALPLTLRPVGHPYRREIAAEANLAAALLAAPDTEVAVADEGPGFSGSSFAAVATWLEGRGVPLAHIHLVPSHSGAPGGQSDPGIQRVWCEAPRHTRTFDDIVLGAAEPAHRLESWVADLVGHPTEPMIEISGGGWRRHRALGSLRPPVLAWQEKRKFLLRTAFGSWLLRFVGLGSVGLSALARAQALASAGFTPPVLGWRHGFLVEAWLGEAGTLAAVPRAALVEHVGLYLGFRAAQFPAGGRGASIAALHAMACHNVAEGVGERAASVLAAWQPRLEALEGRRRPVETDNRLHAWEWLVQDGRLLKTDALDHHAGHDLVGPQDVAWDIAGATIELELGAAEAEALAGIVARASGHPVDAELIAFCRHAYAAFQLGYYAMAAAGTAEGPERIDLEAAAERYRTILGRSLLPL